MAINHASSRHHGDDQHPPVSPAQFHTLLETSHDHRLHPLLLLAATTGLRRNELINLRWADLDLTSRTILVTGPPKLRSAGAWHTRRVALSNQAVAALTRWRELQHRERLARGPVYHNEGYVFTGPDGRPYRPAYLARIARKLMRRAGIHHANLHNLRTFATSQPAAATVQKG